MLYEAFLHIAELVHKFGYFGIFIMTFIESTFIPIPAEFTLIPAGYLIQKGELNGFVVAFVSTVGTLGGSLLNYYIAYHYGRKLIAKYGKYILLSEEKLHQLEKFFEKYGSVSTFIGKLLPGLKHFISFPAGLAKMNLKKFILFTTAGGFVWCSILLLLGRFIGKNENLLQKYLQQINFAIFILVVCTVGYYFWKNKYSSKDPL